MTKWIRAAAALAAGVLLSLIAAAPSEAQAPPPSPPPVVAPGPPPLGPAADDIRACLCMKQSVDAALSAMTEKRRALDEQRRQLADADAALQRERSALDVNDSQKVAEFRQHLAQRDQMFNHISRDSYVAATAAVEHYNRVIGDYNGRCTNRPFDSVLMGQIQATLSCPAP